MKQIRSSVLPQTTYSVAEFRTNIGDIGGDVFHNRTIVYVEKRDVPRFAIISVDDAKILEFIRANKELLQTIEESASRPKASFGQQVSALPKADDTIR